MSKWEVYLATEESVFQIYHLDEINGHFHRTFYMYEKNAILTFVKGITNLAQNNHLTQWKVEGREGYAINLKRWKPGNKKLKYICRVI